MDAHEAELIQRVSNIEPILDELKGKIIQQEAYAKIRAQQIPQEKMRALYNGPLKAGDAAKEAFYQSLKKHEPMLIDDLSWKNFVFLTFYICASIVHLWHLMLGFNKLKFVW